MKIKQFFKLVKFEDVHNAFSNCSIEKVRFNLTTNTYAIIIVTPQPINSDAYLKLKEAFLAYPKNFKLKLKINDISNQNGFKHYWDVIFKETFIGKQLSDINVSWKLENKKLTILFNLKSQMLAYKHWEETIKNEFEIIGYDFKIFYDVKKENKTFKDSVKIETVKIMEEKNRIARFNKNSSTYKSQDSKKFNYGAFNKKVNNIKIAEIATSEIKNLEIPAQISNIDSRNISAKELIIYKIGLFDGTKAINGKFFASTKNNKSDPISNLKVSDWVKIHGRVDYDTYDKELVIKIREIIKIAKPHGRKDQAEYKRIEFSAHTKMSAFDGVIKPSEIIQQAISFGHKGLAITDQDNVQAYPELQQAFDKVKDKNPNFKLVYGLMMNTINGSLDLIKNPTDELLSKTTFVVFDVETTGLSSHYDDIIEFAAVKVNDGSIIEQTQFFIKTDKKITDNITQLTGITKEMTNSGISQEEAANKIAEFFDNKPLVAHNAQFDIGFIKNTYIKHHLGLLNNSWIDTLHLSWILSKTKRSYKLAKLAREFSIEYDAKIAHRADYDTNVLTKVFIGLLEIIKRKHPDIRKLSDLTSLTTIQTLTKQFGYNINLYAKNQKGIKQIYKIVSKAHINMVNDYEKKAAATKELIKKYRENLVVASGGNQSEIIEIALNKNLVDLQNAIEFYDVIIINPPQSYKYLIEKNVVRSMDILIDALKRIITEAERQNKMVIAVADTFFLEPADKVYRDIFVETKRLGGKPHPLKDYANRIKDFPNKYFKTTNELLEEFKFLGEQKATEIVVRNPNILLDSFQRDLKPLRKELQVPVIDDSEKNLVSICMNNARKIYGNNLPKQVKERLDKEINAIVSHNFHAIYYISHLIVKKSLDDGYLVGSRGSVGSSLVATMTNITEVNPLPPHYICACAYSDFDVNPSYLCGFDLPPKPCPSCGNTMFGQGHNIPFETFLGFEGDKIPDIDLNFSGVYQQKAHEYTKELFGEHNVFRAGTISTIQNKTAFGYVKNYQEINQLDDMTKPEIERLRTALVGTKRTTGQHPGGIMVLPKGYDITDFTPVNYPANSIDDWITTHFDYHSIHDNLLKLDLLGHVDPTAIRMLQDITGVDPKDIPFNDSKVIALFSNQTTMKLKKQIPFNETTGAIGIPEFGTSFVRDMLKETEPKSFSDLIILSGLSHGTGVYRGNSRELILGEGKTLQDVIGCRDDIMVFLIKKGLSNKDAFDIMEFIRKGMVPKEKSTWAQMVQKMQEVGVEEWWMESSGKINYLFPKAHATAYVMMAWRIAWFKVYYPLEYYSTLFSLRCDAFDIKVVSRGESVILQRFNELKEAYTKTKWQMTNKEIDLLKTFEMILEMYARGFEFANVDLEKSHSTMFIAEKETNKIIPPFIVVDGLGKSAAKNVIEAREVSRFTSQKDLAYRTKLNKTNLTILKEIGVLNELPNDDQITLFDF